MATKIKGFNYVAQSENSPAKLYIYGIIGWDVMSKDVVDALNLANGDIEIHINSVGGDCIEGNAIYNAIKSFKGVKIAIIDGVAGSAASYIMLACDKIKAFENATVFVHNPLVEWCGGNAKDLEKYAGDLKKVESEYVKAYCGKSGKTEEEVRAAMDAETLFSAQEALEFGLVDEIISDDELQRKESAKAFFKMVARFDYTKNFNKAKSQKSKSTKGLKMEIKNKDDLKAALESLKELEGDALNSAIDDIANAVETLTIEESAGNANEGKGDGTGEGDGTKEAMTKESVEAIVKSCIKAALEDSESKMQAKFNKFLGQGFNGKDSSKSHSEIYNSMPKGADKTAYFKAHKADIMAGK